MYLLDTNVISELRNRQAAGGCACWPGRPACLCAAQYVSVLTWLEIDIEFAVASKRCRASTGLWVWLDGVRALFAERSLPVDDAVVQCCAAVRARPGATA